MSTADPNRTLQRLIENNRDQSGPVVFLTGAGISAESGIPTFRGPEGYWQVGSTNYHPQELATETAFRRMPEEIWAWYLFRRSICNAAEPNAAHAALVDLESRLGEDFLLITQNVDGLHLRAGHERQRVFEIHGNLDFTRCAAGCHPGLSASDDSLLGWEKGRRLDAAVTELLTCERCGDWLRPHVLWFDECYDEPNFRFESSLAAADRSRLLVVIGTSGATNLPMQVASRVAQRGGTIVVIDPEPSPFSEMAEASPTGLFLRGTAGDAVPMITALL